ncbi:MAG: TIGR01777 family oxidoreductase [Bacteroidota bacterium]
MKSVIITGATGLIGSRISRILSDSGYTIIVYTRNARRAADTLPYAHEYVEWDYDNPRSWQHTVDGAYAVINLAGASIGGGRWTDDYKDKIYNSRIRGTGLLAEAISTCGNPPQAFVSASAVGYYGDGGDRELTEDAPSGSDFLAKVCRDWEAAANIASGRTRVVNIRTGIVLHPEEGALAKMITPFKMFIGGPLGSGKQWFPWIHHEDIAYIYKYAIENDIAGPANATAPYPVRMKEFADTLGQVIGRPSSVKTPEFALRLALGESADMVIKGQKAIPQKLLKNGFEYRHPRLEEALGDLM